MNEEKDADYYFEKLKDRGLDKEKYYSQALNPTHKSSVLYPFRFVSIFKR